MTNAETAAMIIISTILAIIISFVLGCSFEANRIYDGKDWGDAQFQHALAMYEWRKAQPK